MSVPVNSVRTDVLPDVDAAIAPHHRHQREGRETELRLSDAVVPCMQSLSARLGTKRALFYKVIVI
jgi:hypothetical protein